MIIFFLAFAVMTTTVFFSAEKVHAQENDPVTLNDRATYELLLTAINNKISDLANKISTQNNIRFDHWNSTFSLNHSQCLVSHPSSYCDLYSIKNNWIASITSNIEYLQFRLDVHDILMQKARLSYVGIENGEVVSEGPLLENINFAADYQENNVAWTTYESNLLKYGNFLRNTISNFNPENYKELSEQILEDHAKNDYSTYYLYQTATNQYDRLISFDGRDVRPSEQQEVTRTTVSKIPNTLSPLRNSFRISTTELQPTSTISIDKNLATTSSNVNCTPNTLIKGSLPAVYFCGADGKRYVFPNKKTYDTWYTNFDGVIEISNSDLASIKIGGNVTHRPGIRMVKIISSPIVYAIAKGGVLRPIASEEVARELYGDSWNQYIDDIPDAFFTNYVVGSEINF